MTLTPVDYENIELHISPEPLARKHVNRIRACAGSYSKCLSPYANRRYVLVPATERALIDDLVRTYSYEFTTKVTMIARGQTDRASYPAWVVVQDVDPHASTPPLMQFEQKYRLAYMQAVKRGIIKEKTDA